MSFEKFENVLHFVGRKNILVRPQVLREKLQFCMIVNGLLCHVPRGFKRLTRS